MKYKDMKNVQAGSFIARYDLTYELADGREKIYEMISRDKQMETKEDLLKPGTDAVVLIMHDENGQRVLLNREFRMATGRWVYNFPAGLLEKGEEPEEGARRELREETGLELLRIDDWLFESYSAVGFSNEKNVCVVGVAGGTFAPSTDMSEEIEAGWFTKAQVRELLKEQHFAARTQAYCYLWSREERIKR